MTSLCSFMKSLALDLSSMMNNPPEVSAECPSSSLLRNESEAVPEVLHLLVNNIHLVYDWEAVNHDVHWVYLSSGQVLGMTQNSKASDVCRSMRLILPHQLGTVFVQSGH